MARRPSRDARFGTRRPTNSREPKPIVVIVCDDTRTACSYFSELKRIVAEDVAVRIIPAPHHGATPGDLIEHARQAFQQLDRGDETGPRDRAWALLDVETECRRHELRTLQQSAASGPVLVALSHPCFEVWTLAHFVRTREHFASCADVLHRVQTEWRRRFSAEMGRKAQADYRKLMSLVAAALENSRAPTDRATTDDDPSWTEIHLVVQSIVDLVRSPGTRNKLGVPRPI